jgi:hypothetical protein
VPDEDSIALIGKEGAGGQLAHQRLVDRCARELEVGQLLRQRQLGDGEPILDRARLLFGDLGLEQLADDPRHRVLPLEPVGDHLVKGSTHAGELQLVHDRKDLLAFHQMALRRLS